MEIDNLYDGWKGTKILEMEEKKSNLNTEVKEFKPKSFVPSGKPMNYVPSFTPQVAAPVT